MVGGMFSIGLWTRLTENTCIVCSCPEVNSGTRNCDLGGEDQVGENPRVLRLRIRTGPTFRVGAR